MATDGEGQTLKGVETGFKIVRHLRESGPTTVTELSDALDLPKSTAHIYLKTLNETGYLRKTNYEYRLSLRFLDHGAAIRDWFDIYGIAKPEIDALALETGEVANLGVEEGGQRVLLYKTEGSEALYDNAHTGQFTNMHWTSLGKAILAYKPEEQILEILDEHGLPRSTDETFTDIASFRDELADIREQGYALEDEEHWENIRAVAVPVLSDETVLGAISVSGPVTRFSDDRIEGELLEALEKTANVIELKMKHY